MLKKILLCFAAGLTALGLGLGIFYAGEFLVSIFQTSEMEKVETREIAMIEPKQIPVEELVYPKAAETETEEIETEEENDEFYVSNFYYIIGDAPKGFENCKNLTIQTTEFVTDSEGNYVDAFPIPPRGSVFQDYEKPQFNLARLSIINRDFSFETETRNKISYQFIGKFIDGETVRQDESTDNAYLTGKLTKMKNGKKIAEQDVKFGISEKCWH
jgi:hypothetical protein